MLSRGGPAESRIALSQRIEGQLCGKSLIGRSWPKPGTRRQPTDIPDSTILSRPALSGGRVLARKWQLLSMAISSTELERTFAQQLRQSSQA